MSETQRNNPTETLAALRERKARDIELLAIQAVRRVVHRAQVSPALALAIAELSGLIREPRHV